MKKGNVKSWFADIGRAVLFAVLISLVLVLALAVVLKVTDISDKTLDILLAVVKFASLCIGVFLGFRNLENGLLKGLAAGLVFIAFSYLFYGILDNGFENAVFSWVDMGVGGLVGAISGIAAVNLKKKR